MSPQPGLLLLVVGLVVFAAVGVVCGVLAAVVTVPVLRRERRRGDPAVEGAVPSTARHVLTGAVLGGGAAPVAVVVGMSVPSLGDLVRAVSLPVWLLGSLAVVVGPLAVLEALHLSGSRSVGDPATGTALRVTGSLAATYVALFAVLGLAAMLAL